MSKVIKLCETCAERRNYPFLFSVHVCGAPATCECKALHVEIVPDEIRGTSTIERPRP